MRHRHFGFAASGLDIKEDISSHPLGLILNKAEVGRCDMLNHTLVRR